MSYSTDTLKKKVCVTVFLDELFEEVRADDAEKSKELTDAPESQVKISEPSSRESRNYQQQVRISLDGYVSPKEFEVRPRKHRKESKFSKNPCLAQRTQRILKNLNKYRRPGDTGHSGGNKKELKGTEAQHPGCSGSELDERVPQVPQQVTNAERNKSGTDLSDRTRKGYQSKALCCKPPKKTDVNCQYDVITCSSKSTQVDNPNSANEEKADENVCLLEEEQKQIVEDLAWLKTQKQIQLILAKAKDWYEVNETCERRRIRRYDLRSILEECEKADDRLGKIGGKACSLTEDWRTDMYESDTRDLSDSYTCVFPHNKLKTGLKGSGLKRVSGRMLGMCGFESDTSELDCLSYDRFPQVNYNPLLCYTSCVNCKISNFNESKMNDDESQSQSDSDITARQSSLDSLKSQVSKMSQNSQVSQLVLKSGALIDEGDRDLPILTLLSNETVAGKKATTDILDYDKTSSLSKISSSMDYNELQMADNGKSNSEIGSKSPNSEIGLSHESDKERALVPEEEEALKQNKKGQASDGDVDNFVNTKRNEEDSYENVTNQKGIAEVFVKRKSNEDNGKILSEVESETIFAENVNSSESRDFVTGHPGRILEDKIEILEFEDPCPRPNVLRRMKTVELVGNGSISEMQNVSAEVILVCENISNEDVCLEAWQSSVTTLKSLSEMGQCYLKDSKDSTMYLIEIPFHFTRQKVI